MSLCVGQIMQWCEELAPTAWAAEWDNVGLQTGSSADPAAPVMTCLTLTQKVLDQAISAGAKTLICHHPPLWRPLASLRDNPVTGLLLQAVRAHIAIYACHTNLDVAPNGAGEWLGRALNLEHMAPLAPVDSGNMPVSAGYGRVGMLPAKISSFAFIDYLSHALSPTQLQQAGPVPKFVQKVAALNGSGAEYINMAADSGADVYVTGDVKFHDAELAWRYGLWVIDAGHFATEAMIPTKLAAYMRNKADKAGMQIVVSAALEKDLLLPPIYCI